MLKSTLKGFNKCASLYVKEYLCKQFINNKLQINLDQINRNTEKGCLEGFKYFIYHALMRGRNDELSLKYYSFFLNSLKDRKIDELDRKILESEGLNNKKDVIMILDVIKRKNPGNNNIWKQLGTKIRKGKCEEIYIWLDDIKEIGDKLACFIIADYVLLNKVKISSDDDMIYAMPVDTWIYKAAKNLGFENKNKTLTDNTKIELKKYMLKICKENGYDPIKIMCGAWYWGYKSFFLLFGKNEKGEALNCRLNITTN